MVGLIVTLFSVLSLNPLTLANLGSLPLRLWSLITAFFRVKRKPWGVVYNSVTKEPLDPAVVVLKDKHGEIVSTSITDLDGRYGFLVKPGMYIIEANKTGYTFPSTLNKKEDELYSDLYYGEKIHIKEEGEVITYNIPLDPIATDWNAEAKTAQHLMTYYTKQGKTLAQISTVVFTLGLIISIIALIANQSTYNIVLAIIYILIFILRQFGFTPKPWGSVTDSSGYGLPYAIIRIYSSATDTEIAHKVTDATGRYYCLIQNGNYYATVEKPVSTPVGGGKNETTYTKILKTPEFEVKKGYVSEGWEV
jgi:hypothetical protein